MDFCKTKVNGKHKDLRIRQFKKQFWIIVLEGLIRGKGQQKGSGIWKDVFY
ncbi:MAG: hypothetical protein LBF22_09850 [Deltaproteobacteria bacterium]|nr:hypothetical protein [Deltaproteobacteria bacterium]